MTDPYASHLPVTARMVADCMEMWPELPVLELGCGHYSTPLLEAMCWKRAPFHVYASDANWLQHFTTKAAFDKRIALESWDEFELTEDYSFCLLDNEELVVDRAKRLDYLLDKCRVVVMHDWRTDSRVVLPQTRSHVIYTRYTPWTLIASRHLTLAATTLWDIS
jgi:hypothetical protein